MKHTALSLPVPQGLVRTGPLVEVQLSPHQSIAAILQKQGKPVPGLTTKMMVDTGAHSTLVSQALVSKLGVQPIRFTPVTGVSGKPENYPVYPLSLAIKFGSGGTGALLSFNADVIGMPSMLGGETGGLLGRDFLLHFELFYDGPNGFIELRVPDGLKAKIKPPPVLPGFVPGGTPLVSPSARPGESRKERRARERTERKAAKRKPD